MPANRYFTEGPLHPGDISLGETESYHLQKVMRAEVGDKIEVINGEGALAMGMVTALLKKEVRVHLHDVDFREKTTSLTLIQAIPSLSHLELIAEKGVELGMNELILFQGDKSQGHLSDSKIQRLKLKQIAALKQSGRLYLPKIRFVKKLSELAIDADFLCYGDLSTDASLLLESLNQNESIRSIAFCSGPESGLSTSEIQCLKEKGYKGVSLHCNILRCETAPMAFLSLAHYFLRVHSNSAIVN